MDAVVKHGLPALSVIVACVGLLQLITGMLHHSDMDTSSISEKTC